MNTFDRAFQNGSRFMVLLGIGLVLFFAVYAVLDPARRYISLFLVLMALVTTGRQVLIRRRKQAQHGVELLGTDPRP